MGNERIHRIHAFASEPEKFTTQGHILDHKIDYNKFKIIGIIASVFLNHNGIKLEIDNRKISGETTTM